MPSPRRSPASRRAMRAVIGRLLTGRSVLPALFLVLTLPVCVFLALAVPPGEVPDEAAHVARAGSLLHGQIIGERRPTTDGAGNPIAGSGVVANPGPLQAAFGFTGPAPIVKKMTVENLERLQAIAWGAAPIYIGVPNTSVYFPVFYVPAAVALGAAHVLHVTPYTAFLAARLANVAAYVALGVLALFLARRGRRLLFVTLTLPMSLWLAASCNQDGLLIASTCLAAACLTAADRPAGRAYWSAGILLACIIAVKPPYVPLAAAMLLPCRSRERGQWVPAGAAVALAVVPGLVWAVIAAAIASAPFVFGPPYHPGPLWPGDPARLFPGTDPGAQAQVFLSNPLLLITLPLKTLADWWYWKLVELVGVLGPLDVVMPSRIYHAWFVVVGVAALGDMLRVRSEPRGPAAPVIVLGLVAVVATVFAIYDLQYLSWTLVGNPVIEGVQGRYGLPLLALLAVMLPLLRVPGLPALRTVSTVPALGMAAFGLVYLPLLVLRTYYLR